MADIYQTVLMLVGVPSDLHLNMANTEDHQLQKKKSDGEKVIILHYRKIGSIKKRDGPYCFLFFLLQIF